MSATHVGGFEIVSELARGGMGVVYRARDPRDGREVALKLLLVARSAGTQERARFAREIEALRRLAHPGIVQVIAAGEEQGAPFLALELVAGGSLEARLTRGGPLPAREAAALVLTLTRALEHVHALGLVHRDLKPANVLLDRAGAPKLTDFGILKDLDPARSQLTQSGSFLGTPGYWAPEQCGTSGVPVGPGTDIHGLGALLYATLTGGPPYEGASLIEIVVATKEREPRPPSRVRAGIDPALDAICLRCLAKDPLDRYSDCKALAAALEAFLAGRRVVPARSRRSQRRLRRALLGVSALAVALAAGVVVAVTHLPPPPPSTPPALPAAPAPLDADALRTRGRTRLLAGDLDGAIADCTAALALDPRQVKALTHRAFAYLQRGDRRAAIVDYTAALALDPRQADVLHNRGLARAQEGDADGALADFEAALEVDPKSADARFERGLLRDRRGDPSGAIEDFSAIIAVDPRRADALNNRGLLRNRLGDLPGAIADYTAALDVDPRAVEARANRGSALHRSGDRDGALSDFDTVLAIDPRHDQALHNRGLIRQERGDLERALADYAAALAIRPSFVTHYARGTLYQSRGEADAAARDFAAALALEPDHPLAAELRRQLGQ